MMEYSQVHGVSPQQQLDVAGPQDCDGPQVSPHGLPTRIGPQGEQGAVLHPGGPQDWTAGAQDEPQPPPVEPQPPDLKNEKSSE